VFGSGLGPLAVGVLSDFFAARGHAEDSLRWALSVTLFVAIGAAVAYGRAGWRLSHADYSHGEARP
jgi:hypothetical protein